MFTPIELAEYCAMIANGGTRYSSHIVLGVTEPGESTVPHFERTVLGHATLSKETHEKHQPEEEQQRENDPVQDKRYRTVIG